jgi:Fe-S oxidoreductase
VDIPFSKRWDEIKEWLVDQGLGLAQHRPLMDNVRATYNIYGEPAEERDAWFPADVERSDSPEVIYWAGCAASYRKQNIAQSVVKLLKAGRVRFSILGKKEWCCGARQLRVGYGDLVRTDLAPHNIHELEKTGAKAVITSCAECYRAWFRDYRELAGNPPASVFSVSQFVETLVKRGSLKFTNPVKKKVAFHDACQQGRNSGQYDSPRNLLKMIPGVQLVEMFRNKEQALCSGVNGGFEMVWPLQAENIAKRRLQMALEAGAEVVATTCPFTIMQLEEEAQKMGLKIEIRDVAELAAEALVAPPISSAAPATSLPETSGSGAPPREPGALPISVAVGEPPQEEEVEAKQASPPRPAATPPPQMSPEERQRRIEEGRKKAEEIK